MSQKLSHQYFGETCLNIIHKRKIYKSTSKGQDVGTRELKIYGCEYRVAKQILFETLGYYGELLTDIVEELFEDGANN